MAFAACDYGECDRTIEWTWDVESKSDRVGLTENFTSAMFNERFSNGTAVIRGTTPLSSGQHYWEIKIISEPYGTDVMVGIGTNKFDMHGSINDFCSLLGINSESWGLSYKGVFQHERRFLPYADFCRGTSIGVHLDMWNGTLSFYKNGENLGIATTGLKGKVLYPMACSTAAHSELRIVQSCSFPTSLQFLCCVVLRKSVPLEMHVLDVLPIPYGLQRFLKINLNWLLRGHIYRRSR